MKEEYLPEEAVEMGFETMPTPDKYREQLGLEVNKINDLEKLFVGIRLLLRWVVVLELVWVLITAFRYQATLWMSNGVWSLILNTFGTLSF